MTCLGLYAKLWMLTALFRDFNKLALHLLEVTDYIIGIHLLLFASLNLTPAASES